MEIEDYGRKPAITANGTWYVIGWERVSPTRVREQRKLVLEGEFTRYESHEYDAPYPQSYLGEK